MTRTRHDEPHHDFTNRAHRAARKQIYPYIVGVESYDRLKFEDTDFSTPEGKLLDGEHGIDRIVHCKYPYLDDFVSYGVQERFRVPKPRYSNYFDLTITKFNNASGKKSELSKLHAQIFVYGYYDEAKKEFSRTIACNTYFMIRYIGAGVIGYGQNANEKEQDFITIPFKDLISNRIAFWWSEDLDKKYREEGVI